MGFQSGRVANQQFIKSPVVLLLTTMGLAGTQGEHDFFPTVIA
jgi:hypothetical protein